MLQVLLIGSMVATIFALYMTVERFRAIFRSLDAIERRQPIPTSASWLPWGLLVSMLAAPGVSIITTLIVFAGIEKKSLELGGIEFTISMVCLLAGAFNLLVNFSIYDRSKPPPTYW